MLPGAVIYLEKSSPDRFLPYTAVAVEREGHPVMVHTHRTNDLVDALLRKGLVPGLEKAQVVKREAAHGRSRFDFLLRDEKKEIYLEVKSCTLFGKDVAMFPDAVTERGRRHVEELFQLRGEGKSGAVLFLICWSGARFFLPDYHTDLNFARTLLSARKEIRIIPLSIGFGRDLSFIPKVRLLEIPWERLETECEDRGSYMLILRLPAEKKMEIGRLGKLAFKPGYYLYVGSARKNLTQRLERHRRQRKKIFWHVDYFRAQADFYRGLPIRSSEDLECDIASALKKISDWEVSHFGCSDCACGSHLFGMRQDPFRSPGFISLLQHFRMDRNFR